MKVIFTALTTLFICGITYAQKPGDPLPGFGVTVDGDTIRGGVVALRKDGNFRPSFQVKLEDETSKSLSPKKTKYVLAGDMEFDTFVIPGNPDGDMAFFYRKSSGKVILYEYQFQVYEMNKTVWKSEFYLKSPDKDELERINKANYKKKLSALFSDNPELQKQVDQVKFEEIHTLFDMYNEA